MNTRAHMPALAAALLLLQQGCTSMPGTSTNEPAPGMARLQGIATYTEAVTLPADATLDVIIEDVSRAGAAAEVIARTRIENPGSFPIPFTVDYPADRIQPRNSYNVRGRLEQQGRLLFISDMHHALPPAGSTPPFELKLVRTGVSAASTASLVNTYWKLLQLGDAKVTTPEGQREVHLVLQSTKEAPPRLTGFSGCNRMMGSYSLDGSRIAFTQVGGTKMACAQGMETERAFHAMLGRAERWAIRGEQLDLFDAAGTRIALFESVYLR